ncbi:MAG: O-antigen ligase family protein, partial [Thermoguttaceae bacterium]|nr:O-antigen ligase family protein [Thermoguttaceae bacterium]
AAAWVGVLFVRGGLVAGCLAVLAGGICLGHPWFHLDLGPVPLTTDRVLWVALVVQYVAWRRLGRTDPKPWRVADVALLAFLGVLVASTFAHDWRARGLQPVARLVFFYLMPLGLYWVARQAELTERSVRAVLAVLVALGIYLATTAIAEVASWDAMVFPRYIASPEHPEFLGRARGPLLNPMGNGVLLGTCLAAVLVGWPRCNRLGKLVVVALAALMAAGLYCTLTRSVWLGGALGLLVVVTLPATKAWRAAVFAGAGLVALLVVGTQWDRLMAFERDRGLSARETADSVELRPMLAEIAWRMFRDRPIFGCGFGQYLEENRNYLADRSSERPLEKARPYVQHNLVLSLLTETGLVGAALFALVLVCWIRQAWTLWRTREAPPWARQFALVFLALVANYGVNGMFHDMSLVPMVHAALFFAAGLNAGVSAHAGRSRSGWNDRPAVDLDRPEVYRIGAGA